MLANLTQIIGAVVPVFLLIVLGALLRRVNFMDDVFTSGLNKLVFWVAAPALLFRSIAKSNVVEAFDFWVILTMVVLTIVTALVMYLLSRPAGLEPERKGVFVQGCFRGNLAFLGLAVLQSVYGDTALAPASVMIAFLTPLYNILAVIVLMLPHQNMGRGSPLKTAGREIVTNPLIIACVAGMVAGLAKMPMPLFFDRSLQLSGQIALPLALIAVGSSLDFQGLLDNLRLTALVSLVKLVLLPLVLWGLLVFKGVDPLALRAGVILLACPTAVVSYIMAHQMKGNPGLAASIITGTTLVSIVSMTGWLLLLSAH